MNSHDLPLPSHRLAPADGRPARAVVVLLHGVGSNGADLIGLAPYWAQALPEVEFLSPDAPEAYDMAPPGYDAGRQWFSLADRNIVTMTAGIEAAAPKVGAYLDAVGKRLGLANDRMALVGFSQGSMMALHLAQRRSPALAGVVGFSGALLVPSMAPERPPILLIHGTEDPVVPFAAMAAARAGLALGGGTAETLACPGLGHSIDEAGITRSATFLRGLWRSS